MTTNTANSQAASIDTYGDPRFEELSTALYRIGFHQAGSGDAEAKALADYIDAKLAQAREEGRRDSHETNVTMLNLKLKAEDRATDAEDRAEKAEQYAQVALGIKDSLEARLAEIQRGVEENLQRYQAEVIINASDAFMEENDEGKYVLLEAVRTLFDSTYDIGTPEVIQLLRDITEQCGASEMYYIPGDLEDRIKDMLAKYDQSESKP